MDVLNDLSLARCQRFLNNCSTVAPIFIVKKRFVRHHLVSPIAVWIKFVLLCLYRKRTSHVQFFQVRPRLCHSTFLWRLACEMSQQVHSISSWESNFVTLSLAVDGDQNTANERWRGQMPHSRIAAASSGTSSSCLISNGCSFQTWEAVNQHWLILHFIIGLGVTTRVVLMVHAF